MSPCGEPTVTQTQTSARTAHGVDTERIIDLKPPAFGFVAEGGQYTVRDRRTARRARVVAAIPARIPRKSLRKRRLSKGAFLDLTLVVVYSPRKSFDVIFCGGAPVL